MEGWNGLWKGMRMVMRGSNVFGVGRWGWKRGLMCGGVGMWGGIWLIRGLCGGVKWKGR